MIDYSRWAVVANKDDSGFGRQAESIKMLLGVKWHFVIPSDRLNDKPLADTYEEMLPMDAPDSVVRGLLSRVDGIIFFEHPRHPSLLRLCRQMSVTSVCSPNWEWFRGRDAHWNDCDAFICTSDFSKRIVERYGFHNARNIGAWPLSLQDFPARRISGQARHFVHNAGLVDQQDRKGTSDVIQAFKRVRRDDVTLTVRMQVTAKIPEINDPRIEVHVGNLEHPSDLYREGDVAVQPSKMEGNGFMVLEPLYSGMPVITLDYPPMNEYVTDERLLIRKRPFKRRAYPTAWVKHAHLRLPSIRDLTHIIEWCAENDMTPISSANRTLGERVCDQASAKQRWTQAIREVCQC